MAFELGVHRHELGHHVGELCEFDLEHALFGPCSAGEDIENQLGSVDNFSAERFFKVSLLHPADLTVDKDHVGFEVGGDYGDFFDFSGAYERSFVGSV